MRIRGSELPVPGCPGGARVVGFSALGGSAFVVAMAVLIAAIGVGQGTLLSHFLVRIVPMVGGAIVVGLVGLGLLRLRRWAWWGALVGSVAIVGLSAESLVILASDKSAPGTDGNAYAGMGAIELAFAAVVAVLVLVLPSTWRPFSQRRTNLESPWP